MDLKLFCYLIFIVFLASGVFYYAKEKKNVNYQDFTLTELEDADKQ